MNILPFLMLMMTRMMKMKKETSCSYLVYFELNFFMRDEHHDNVKNVNAFTPLGGEQNFVCVY